jgi:hypothetical protein
MNSGLATYTAEGLGTYSGSYNPREPHATLTQTNSPTKVQACTGSLTPTHETPQKTDSPRSSPATKPPHQQGGGGGTHRSTSSPSGSRR